MPVPVVISWLFPDKTSGWFTWSIADLMRWDAQGPQHVCQGDGGFIALSSGPRVAEARNIVVDRFAAQYPKAEWLLMVDSDMTFEADLIERLIESADPVERPIMGALAFMAPGDHRGARATIYEEVMTDSGVFVNLVDDYPRDQLVKVGATGAAGLLIHRNVLGAMNQPWPKGFGTLQDGTPNPYPWFSEGLVNPDGKPLGEDVAFCRRAWALGIPTHVDTRIKMGHMKTYKLDEQYFLAQRRDEALATGDRAARRRAARAKTKVRP